jgi:PAS domain S-box-containing protein
MLSSKNPNNHLFNTISDAIIVTDLEYNIKDWNKAAERIYGWSAEEIIGKNIMETIKIEYINQNPQEIINKFEKEGKWKGEVSQYTKGGKKINIFSSVSLIKNDSGVPEEIVAINQNLTKRRKIQRRLKESQEAFKTMAEQSLIGLQIVQDGKLKYMNEKAAEYTGHTVNEVKNMDFSKIIKFIHPADIEIIQKRFRKRLKKDQEINKPYQFRTVDKEGKVTWLKSLNKIIKYQGRDADLIFLLDITDMKKAEIEIKKSEEKYKKAYNQANFYKDLFIHDINNILQVINSSNELMAHLLKESNISKDIYSLSNLITKQINKGAELIESINKFSQLEDREINVHPIDVIKLLNKVIRYIKHSYEDRNISIEIQGPFEEYFIQANQLLEEVFENLLINSIKHNSNQNIKIIVKLDKEIKNQQKYLKLQFIDNGIGIKDNRKLLIFQKHKNSTNWSKGMGFGLSLVKTIIDIYNGKIWVEDRVKGNYKHGSIFNILIPVKN